MNGLGARAGGGVVDCWMGCGTRWEWRNIRIGDQPSRVPSLRVFGGYGCNLFVGFWAQRSIPWCLNICALTSRRKVFTVPVPKCVLALPARNLHEVLPMKTTIGLFVFALCGSLTATAQIALPGCGCSVSSSAVSCSCPGAVNKKTGESTNKRTICGGRRELSEDSIVLSPGATLRRWVPGEVDLIVGTGGGELENEAKSPPLPITMSAGVVLFMPKQGPYALRNVGKQDLHIIVIRMRPTNAAVH